MAAAQRRSGWKLRQNSNRGEGACLGARKSGFWQRRRRRRRRQRAGGEPPQACSSHVHPRTCSGCSRLNLVTCTTVCWPLDAMLRTAAAGVWTLPKLGPTGRLGGWSLGSRRRQRSKDQTHSPWLLCRREWCRHISAACNISSQGQNPQIAERYWACHAHRDADGVDSSSTLSA